MKILSFILLNNIAPIFLLIFLGYMVGKKFKIDLPSLSKLNIYLFIPALIVVKVSQAEIDLSFIQVFVFSVLFLVAMAMVGFFFSKVFHFSNSQRHAAINAAMFCNSGNYGLPLITLIYEGTPFSVYATSVQVFFLLVQNLATYTVGLFNAGKGQLNLGQTVKEIASMPIVYAIMVAALFKLLPLKLEDFFLWPSIEYLKDALVPVALITLGVQLSKAGKVFSGFKVYLTSFLRIVGGPLVAYVLLNLLGINGLLARILFVSSSVPSSVNTALIAVELNNEPEFASQIVVATTILSSVTVTLVVFIAQFLF